MDEPGSRAASTKTETILSIPSKAVDGSIVHDTIEEVKANFNSDSHAMAQKDYGGTGAIQTHPENSLAGARDIGWHRPAVEVPDPLIGEVTNGRLFAMVRRFNKVNKQSIRVEKMHLTIIRMSSMFELNRQMLRMDSI